MYVVPNDFRQKYILPNFQELRKYENNPYFLNEIRKYNKSPEFLYFMNSKHLEEIALVMMHYNSAKNFITADLFTKLNNTCKARGHISVYYSDNKVKRDNFNDQIKELKEILSYCKNYRNITFSISIYKLPIGHQNSLIVDNEKKTLYFFESYINASWHEEVAKYIQELFEKATGIKYNMKTFNKVCPGKRFQALDELCETWSTMFIFFYLIRLEQMGDNFNFGELTKELLQKANENIFEFLFYIYINLYKTTDIQNSIIENYNRGFVSIRLPPDDYEIIEPKMESLLNSYIQKNPIKHPEFVLLPPPILFWIKKEEERKKKEIPKRKVLPIDLDDDEPPKRKIEAVDLPDDDEPPKRTVLPIELDGGYKNNYHKYKKMYRDTIIELQKIDFN